MSVKAGEIIAAMEEWAPEEIAVNWDNVGLLLGSPQHDINRVLVAFEITPAVVSEAIEKQVQMIMTHHPLIFEPMQRILFEEYPGNLILQLTHAKIAIYAAHTNLDMVPDGVNDILARSLALTDVVNLSDDELPDLARLGNLAQPMAQKDFAAYVQQKLGVDMVRMVKGARPIEKVASCAGSGAHYIDFAVAAGADALVTGDIKHHDALKAQALGLTVVDAGHYGTERMIAPILAMYMQQAMAGLPVDVVLSEVETDPWQVIVAEKA